MPWFRMRDLVDISVCLVQRKRGLSLSHAIVLFLNGNKRPASKGWGQAGQGLSIIKLFQFILSYLEYKNKTKN
jgi:hypothetical protein